MPKINADGGDPATPPDGEQEIVPKVNAIGELADRDGNIVGTLLVLQLPTGPERLKAFARELPREPRGLSPASTMWMYRPVSVEMNKIRQASSPKHSIGLSRKPSEILDESRSVRDYGYAVTVVFTVELPDEPVTLAVSDLTPPTSYEGAGVQPGPPIEIVIPERKNRPHLQPLHAEVAHVGELKNDKVDVRLRMNWQSYYQLLLNNIWVEAVRIDDIQSKGEIHNYLDVSKDRLHRTALLSCTHPTVPKVDAPILLKIRGVDTWVSGDAKPQ